MAVCRWRRDNSQRANLGQGKATDITNAQAACQPGRGVGVRARWAGPGQGQALAEGAGGTERQVEPLRSGRILVWSPWAWPEPVPWRGPQVQAAHLRAVCNELKRLEEWQGENALDAQILSPRIYSCRVSSFTFSAGGWCRPDGRSFTARKAVWCCGFSGGPCSGHGALIQPSSTSRWHLYPINGPSEAIHSISAADTVG